MTPQTFVQVWTTVDHRHIMDRQKLAGHHDLPPVWRPIMDWTYWTTLEKVQIDSELHLSLPQGEGT